MPCPAGCWRCLDYGCDCQRCSVNGGERRVDRDVLEVFADAARVGLIVVNGVHKQRASGDIYRAPWRDVMEDGSLGLPYRTRAGEINAWRRWYVRHRGLYLVPTRPPAPRVDAELVARFIDLRATELKHRELLVHNLYFQRLLTVSATAAAMDERGTKGRDRVRAWIGDLRTKARNWQARRGE